MSSSKPLVTIGVPTYNSARFLRQCLDSISTQTYENIEVLISDNGSVDETVPIAREYEIRCGFKVIVNKENVGALNNWNRILGLARGKYLAIYHSDDIYEPAIVEESVALLERDSTVGLVGTLATVINEREETSSSLVFPYGVSAGPFNLPQLFDAVLRYESGRILLITPSIMVRRKIYDEVGSFDSDEVFTSSADYEMWFRIAMNSKVSVIPKPLMKYRIHPGQGSEIELRKNTRIPDIVLVLERYSSLINDPMLCRKYTQFLARTYLIVALKKNSIGEFSQSSITVDMVAPGKYWLPIFLVKCLNCLRVNIRFWPGRPWPFREASK